MGRDGKKGKGGGRGSRGADSGSRMFIDNAEELQMREREFNEQRTARLKRRGEEDEATVSKSKAENEEQGEDDAEQGGGAPDSVFTFEKPAKATVSAATEKKEPVGEEEEDEELAGGLLGAYKNRNLHRQDVEADPNNPEAGLSRKQRELLAQQRAKEEYMKRHLAGETEQARRDLERLAVIRAKREEDRKKREAEGRPPGWTAEGIQSSEESSDDGDEVETKPTKSSGASKPAAAAAAAPVSEVTAKKKALAAGEGETTATAADGGPPKLKAMDIKKLSGDQLKEHLKARGLDIQGQKKDLIKRLSDYEASRP